jgi:hypothetical protein
MARRVKTFAVYRWENNEATEVGRYKVDSAPAALLAHFKAAGVTDNHEQRKLYARNATKPSAEQLHVLDIASQQGSNIAWVPLVDGKGSQSRTVGRGATIDSCVRRGWLDKGGNLTQAGREARAAEKERQGRS